jgi:transposase
MRGGIRIIRALVGGERDLDILASYRDVRCHASVETIKAALNGNDRPEHIFALTQSLDLYDFYQSKMLECDRNLEAMLDVLAAEQEHDPGQLPKARTKTKQVGTPSFDVRAALFGVLGLDLTQIHGLGPSLSLKLVGECGTDLCAWLSAKHFTSWLCLAPGKRYQVARYCRRAQDGRPAVPPPYCGWQPSQSAVVTPL